MMIQTSEIPAVDVTFQDNEILHFPEGLPGLHKLREFVLIQNDDLEPFKLLRSVDEPNICFTLVSPWVARPDYEFDLSACLKDHFQSADLSECLVFAIVTLHQDFTRTSVNLFAPLVIHPPTMSGLQVMLLESEYRVDERLVQS